MRRIEDMGFTDVDTVAMVKCHHERYDGTGYPLGLMGASIPMAGRLAAIVDAFDAMSADRPHRFAISRSESLHELYAQRGKRFHSELVEEFVKSLGIYPVGSLVELNTGEVAIVMVQNALLRLRPRIMVLTDESKKTLGHFHSMDLSETREDASVHIMRTLGPGAFGLDPSELFL
jgi:HD-GYP domain-containing protein (c-di-GMP phosphodiesterase class II)